LGKTDERVDIPSRQGRHYPHPPATDSVTKNQSPRNHPRTP
jgi:hypothetical protein